MGRDTRGAVEPNLTSSEAWLTDTGVSLNGRQESAGREEVAVKRRKKRSLSPLSPTGELKTKKIVTDDIRYSQSTNHHHLQRILDETPL